VHSRRDDAPHAGQRDHLRRQAGLSGALSRCGGGYVRTTDLAARARRHRAEIYAGGDGVPAYQRRDNPGPLSLNS
jgi:hypothetical protein